MGINPDPALLKADMDRPIITIIPHPRTFPGEKLDKLKDNYQTWAIDMDIQLCMNQLWEYVLGDVPEPSPDSQPNAHKKLPYESMSGPWIHRHCG